MKLASSASQDCIESNELPGDLTLRDLQEGICASGPKPHTQHTHSSGWLDHQRAPHLANQHSQRLALGCAILVVLVECVSLVEHDFRASVRKDAFLTR
jgi:hypothetical protein